MLFNSNTVATRQLAPMCKVQKALLECFKEGFKVSDVAMRYTRLYMARTNFDTLGVEIVKFTGDTPSPVKSGSYSETKFFRKYMDKDHDWVDGIVLYDTVWEEVNREEADFFSMALLPDGQWCFAPCVPNL